MDNRQIIVQEIEKWRKSKILPEHYCDFLLNLYQDETDQKDSAASMIKNSNAKPWIISCVILISLLFAILYFNTFHISVQLGLSGLFLTGFLWVGFKHIRQNKLYSYISFGAGAGFMLFMGRHLINLYELDPIWFIVYVLMCSLSWIILGWITSLGLFQFCGWAGMLLFYAWVVYHQIEPTHWLMVQICWVPLSVILVWIGWLLHEQWKTSARVFLALGLLLWFAAEIYGYVLVDGLEIHTSFTLKLFVACTALFLTRKYWIDWIRGGNSDIDIEEAQWNERM